MSLTTGQRIWRRIKLLGGSYEHPNGYIELDFEAAAGIVRSDSDVIKELKLNQQYSNKRSRVKIFGAGLVGIAVYSVVSHLGMETHEGIGVAHIAAIGLKCLAGH
jgi:hypothetical protein